MDNEHELVDTKVGEDEDGRLEFTPVCKCGWKSKVGLISPQDAMFAISQHIGGILLEKGWTFDELRN